MANERKILAQVQDKLTRQNPMEIVAGFCIQGKNFIFAFYIIENESFFHFLGNIIVDAKWNSADHLNMKKSPSPLDLSRPRTIVNDRTSN